MGTTTRRWIQATIVTHERITPSIVSIKLNADIGQYDAGQHVDIRLTAPDGYQAQRSYSIASAPESEAIELIIERLEVGEVSPYFHEAAAPGDTFELRGPIGGHFIWKADSPEPVLLVAGGSGIAPLLSMLRHRVNTGAIAPFLLVYSARTWEDIVYRDELLAAEANDPGITIVLTTTRGASGRAHDYERRLDLELISEILDNWKKVPQRIYVCGSNRFVEAATSGLIAAKIAPEIIRTERYG
jgi:ferredoxin-NADP reductase